jgi:hypothetical protein
MAGFTPFLKAELPGTFRTDRGKSLLGTGQKGLEQFT